VILDAVAYAVVLVPQRAPVPAAIWLFMMSTTAMTGVIISSLVRRADSLADSECRARLEVERANEEMAS
jgi:hypothetical protein